MNTIEMHFNRLAPDALGWVDESRNRGVLAPSST
jgi:hypothetical protein